MITACTPRPFAGEVDTHGVSGEGSTAKTLTRHGFRRSDLSRDAGEVYGDGCTI
jgi:hypothetical protein